MRILAIDPGSAESALVIYDTAARVPWAFRTMPNEEALNEVASINGSEMAIEKPVARGMPASNQLFEACVWIGRFIERWRGTWTYVDRAHVKLHICHDSRAKDANIRAALIDRYGGKDKAIGRKASPGPLYGLSGDCWAALAVAITAAER